MTKPGQSTRNMARCLYDPSDGAPYRDSIFSRSELSETLRFAYFPSGSVWELDGGTFIVVGDVNLQEWPAAVPQQLESCEWIGRGVVLLDIGGGVANQDKNP